MDTKLCCSDPLPVVSADGSNTVACANCGEEYVTKGQIGLISNELRDLLPSRSEDSDTPEVIREFKSLPSDPLHGSRT